MSTEDVTRRIPTTFPTASPKELQRGSDIYGYYLERRVEAVLENIRHAKNEQRWFELLEEISEEFAGLEARKNAVGLDPAETMRYDTLYIIIFERGLFIPLNESREEMKKDVPS